MTNSIMVTMFLLNLIFLFMFHPLAMILILILQTLMISLAIYSISLFPWFSYTLILVFLGGMLILFTYMSNIASNEMFKPNLFIFLPIVLVPAISLFMPCTKQNIAEESSSMNFETLENFMILKPFSDAIMPLTILMASYIILTLLVIVKISKMNQGPLRVV
uniref:NADH dehydrogenase subunit 6 n=1 Tax=Capitulum mitella TaxID=41070 RepID=Q65Z26_CAPMI|nr:NADH dehydrogenase subunit 6 [Capitulum mitella]AAR87437.1 NADH dehydrogenase subunit 6 [Capitulum mitella]QLM02031.1 NADH dehydrogenase subunit 6 [Capitulum mitella]QYF07872.1 NADH dehydrogenase subunit 6 [Capitulum mitella]BAD44746.1 NADH dehydrogenase subunit 6 [Capitulum mitella]